MSLEKIVHYAEMHPALAGGSLAALGIGAYYLFHSSGKSSSLTPQQQYDLAKQQEAHNYALGQDYYATARYGAMQSARASIAPSTAQVAIAKAADAASTAQTKDTNSTTLSIAGKYYGYLQDKLQTSYNTAANILYPLYTNSINSNAMVNLDNIWASAQTSQYNTAISKIYGTSATSGTSGSSTASDVAAGASAASSLAYLALLLI